MCKIIIELNNGDSYENDSSLGMNLSDVDEIKDCLNESGKYELITKEKKWITLRPRDIKDIKMVK
ncbi:hypothetical protein [Bacillus cereus]|uniref:hypothetical protein n=1 Tax=Bacillus cereus TaxID=1396 RepID=UPI000330399B|nr:hypothetical protein [Bacillus cereus]EOO44226.1 hypothetical protein ICK_06483 [Bacillus cereus BAG1X2-2]EOP00375.1 hypothetical protein ICO_06331 [Bacillus cereus BAG2O-1]